MAPQPLRVLYVMHSGSPAGSAESLCVLLEHLTPDEVAPTVLCPGGDVVPRLRRVATVRLIPGVSMFHSIEGVPLRRFRLLELARTVWMRRHGAAIRAAIRETRPHVVHLNERGMLQAARIAREEGLPVVVHARSVAEHRESWVRRRSLAALRRDGTQVVAIDESVRRSLEGVATVEVVYNPLDERALAVSRPRADEALTPGTQVRVTFLTGLQVYKGIYDLLECAALLRHRADIVFQVAGSNSRPADFHRSVAGRLLHLVGLAPDVESEIRRRIAAERLEPTVRLLGRVEAASVLATTDVLVFPSHLDGPGRSVFEAGARGIPSVVALRHRIQDVVVDGETGLIVPVRDPAALAEAVVRLADDPVLRARLGANARERYRRQFAARPIAQQMLGIYRRLALEASGQRDDPRAAPVTLTSRSSP